MIIESQDRLSGASAETLVRKSYYSPSIQIKPAD
jgi:hypothetical protein